MQSGFFRYVFGLISALIALFAIVLFILLIFVPGCQQTHFAILAPAPYRDAGLPPFPFAQQDREEFRGKFPVENLSERLAPNAKDTSKRGVKASASRETLLFYVSALAGHTDAGVVIYSVESGPDEPEDYLPLDRLWAYLTSLPREQKKILAIDLARGPIDWRWGQFFQAELGSTIESQKSQSEFEIALEKIPNLAILTSAAPGETSWVSPSLSRSVFFHFLFRGLSGDADGFTGQPKDRRITLNEIHKFVLLHTNHWVQQNRELRGQHPQLLTSQESKPTLLEAIVAESSSAKNSIVTEAQKGTEGARIRQLEALWDARDKWSARQPEQRFPLLWRQFREHVRRAEQWWLSGQKEGMDPHLLAAEKAEKDLTAAERNTESDRVGQSFISANLSRRTNTVPSADTQPLQAEKPLQIALQEHAPTTVTKPIQLEILRLRSRAEQNSWQSFRSRRWGGPLLAEADRDRRLSEDLAFVGTPSELERATQLRQSADGKLQQFEEIDRLLSDAHRLHGQLLSELPDLAWWAAQRMPVENLQAGVHQSRRFQLMNEYSQGIDETRFRPPPLSDQNKLRNELDDSSLQQTEIDLLLLFEQTRQLAVLLDREFESDSVYAARNEWRQELDGLRQSLTNPERGLIALKNRLIRHASGLIGGATKDAAPKNESELGQTQYFHWVRLRNALEWSALPADATRGLFAELDQSDRILNSNAQKSPVEKTAEWDGNDWSGVDGCWQAFWSLQSLSLGAPDGSMHERWVAWKNAVVDSKKRLALLMSLGQSVRREFRERVGRALPSPSSDRLDDVMRTLIIADRSLKTLHGYDAVSFPSNRDPNRLLNDFDLGVTCVLQAERYLEDFWGKVKSTDLEPWFVQAADVCLKTAARQNDQLSIEPLNRARLDAMQKLQSRQNARLKIASIDANVDLSLVVQRTIGATTEFDNRLPAGVAALWLTDDLDAKSSFLDFQPSGRQSVSSAKPNADVTIRKVRVPPPSKCGEIAVHPRLLFRGRYWDDSVVQVDPCPPKSVDWEFKSPPSTGEVVVYGVDRRDTIFILDCSFSMSESMNPKNRQGETRFQAARQALTEALRVLRDGPIIRNEKEPHIVGLMAYGHRTKAKDGDAKKTATNPNWNAPIPIAVSEDWRNDFEVLNSPDRLVDDHYRALTANLDKLQPFGQTPLLGSILSAAGKLIDRKRGGIIVAITDGAFNDEALNGPRYKEIRNLLQRHSELSFHLVGFGVTEKTEIEILRTLATDARGTYYDAPNGAALAEAIEKVMKARPFSVLRDVQPREEFISPLGEIVSRLAPQAYQVGFPELASFPVMIEGGERLEFDLDFPNHLLKHRRPQPFLFRRVQNPGSFSPREPTRFGYLKADYDRASATAEFEFCLDRDDALGMIARPAEIDFEIFPQGDHTLRSRSWSLAANQSIPVWRVSMKDWPADGRPIVTATWKMARTAPDSQIPLAELLKAAKSVRLPGWPETGVTVTSEQQPGKVLIRLQTDDKQPNPSVGDIRIELGIQSKVENRFLRSAFNWHRRLYGEQQQATFEFDVGENIDPSQIYVSFTSRGSIERDCRSLESPLVIEKWDKEQ